jgi:iron complex outermembrane receptor protein
VGDVRRRLDRRSRGIWVFVAIIAMCFGRTSTAEGAERPAPPLPAPRPAQVAQSDRAHSFDIPAKPLPQAIADLSAITSIQVLYTENQAFAITSRPVVGSYTAEQALGLMLQGSGIAYRFLGTNAVTLVAGGGESGSQGPITLGPVVVTGEKVDRSLRDTATSVTVLDSQEIEERPGIESANEALERLPNVTTTGTGNLAPAVRGVDGTGPAQGADAFFAGTRPRLNVQIDGRPASYNEVVFGDVSLWDVEQVEVLRGPQSQLQGRNAIAGTVVVKTKDPTYEYEVGARLLGGNFETVQGSAVVSGPIVEDQLAFRLAFDRAHSDSFVHMPAFAGVQDPEEYNSTTLRGKLLLEPEALEGFSTLVTLTYSDYSAPQYEGVARPFDDHIYAFPEAPVFNPRTISGIVETTWELTDSLAFENTFSVADISVERKSNPGTGNVEVDGMEYVEEPLLRFSAFDDRLSGLGGVYFFHADQHDFIDLFGGGDFDDETTTAAIFGELTYAVLDDVDITVGARYEEEDRRRVGGAGPFLIDLDETYRAFLPKFGIAWHATEELTVGAVVARGYNGGGAGFTYNVPFTSYTFDPEYVWNYEAYARADLYGGKLSLTGNPFFADYKDMQLPFDLNPDPDIWAIVIRNADRALTYCAEFGARWLATPELELFADLGLLKTEITEYPGSGVEGHELANAPVFTADFGAIYRHESGFDISADARVSDGYFSSVTNDPRGKTEPYVVVNAQVGYRLSEDDPDTRIFAFITNLFDSGEPVLIEPGATPADDAALLLHPRAFGLGLEMRF